MPMSFGDFQKTKKLVTKGVNDENYDGDFEGADTRLVYLNGAVYIDVFDNDSYYLIIGQEEYDGQGEKQLIRLEMVLFAFALKESIDSPISYYLIFTKSENGYGYIYGDYPEYDCFSSIKEGFDSLADARSDITLKLNVKSLTELKEDLIIDITDSTKEYMALKGYERVPWLITQANK